LLEVSLLSLSLSLSLSLPEVFPRRKETSLSLCRKYFLDAKKPGRVFREYNSAEFVSFSCAVCADWVCPASPAMGI